MFEKCDIILDEYDKKSKNKSRKMKIFDEIYYDSIKFPNSPFLKNKYIHKIYTHIWINSLSGNLIQNSCNFGDYEEFKKNEKIEFLTIVESIQLRIKIAYNYLKLQLYSNQNNYNKIINNDQLKNTFNDEIQLSINNDYNHNGNEIDNDESLMEYTNFPIINFEYLKNVIHKIYTEKL
jgi:hypothetical protein